MRLGGGMRRPSARPKRTAASQPRAKVSGTRRPSVHLRRGATNDAPEGTPARASGCARAGAAMSVAAISTSVGCPREIARIDEIVDRRLHVHIGRNDAGLLQGEAGGEDRLALRLA